MQFVIRRVLRVASWALHAASASQIAVPGMALPAEEDIMVI